MSKTLTRDCPSCTHCTLEQNEFWCEWGKAKARKLLKYGRARFCQLIFRRENH